jgi:hypothetical protein
MAKGKKWIVTTSGNRSLSEIKKELTKAGFGVESVLEDIGVITGTTNDAERLRSISGVSDVSPDQEVDIGPPDAPIQ